jgi:phage shock protein PspC (stress-responsive transcriptional regulator)
VSCLEKGIVVLFNKGSDIMRDKLYRSNQDKMIAGVCGGFAEYFDIDVSLVRVAFVATFFFAGTGFLFYLICALVIPERPY